MKYVVGVARSVSIYGEVRVEAASVEDAEAKVQEMIKRRQLSFAVQRWTRRGDYFDERVFGTREEKCS